MSDEVNAEVALRHQPTAADVERMSVRLGSVRPRDPATGQSATVAIRRTELLRGALAPTTFNASVKWLANQKIGSDNTARNYADDIRVVARLLRDHLGGPLDIGTLRTSDVQEAAELMQAAGHSARTINRRMNAIQSLYSYARTMLDLPDAKIVNRYSRPKIDESSANANATRALTKRELNALFGACKTPRELLAVSLTVAVAGRADEVTSADLRRIKSSDGVVSLTMMRKGGKDRSFPLPAEVLSLIEMVHGRSKSGPVLLNASGEQMTRYALDALLQRLGRRAGVRTCPRAYSKRKDAEGLAHSFGRCRECTDVTPHVLRATKITQLHTEEGWELMRIQRFADHSDPKTTAGYIARWQDDQDRAEGAAVTGRDVAKHLKRFTT